MSNIVLGIILCFISVLGKEEINNLKVTYKLNSAILENKYSPLDKIVNENSDKIAVSVVPLENDDTPYYKN